MDFNEVEAARQAYFIKSQSISKKRKKIFSVAFSIAIVIDLIIATILISQNHGNIFAKSSHFSVMFIIVPTIMTVILELVFIILITHLSTMGNDASKEYLSYKRAYKRYFIARQLANVFTSLDYNHERGLDKKLLQETGLICTGDIYHSNDLVSGKYKDVLFMQADVHIEEEHTEKDTDGHTETEIVTIFLGRYLIFTFPKKFDYKMVISFDGYYDNSYLNPKTERGLNRIETESIDFNKRFLVYAEDGFEAFYILNPAFIESLEKLGRQYDNKLSLYFSDNKLYVGLDDGGDAFEPPNPAVPINEREEMAKVDKDMRLITDIVDNLKLNKK